jgi:hypothetical protein
MCLASTSDAPQKLHLALSPQGLHKWPGSFATAPQFLHVYAMIYLLLGKGLSFNTQRLDDIVYEYEYETIKVKISGLSTVHC